MNQNPEFPCHSCGACCMMLGHILESEDNVTPEYLDLVKEFPYKADEAGWCEKLDENMQCSIYEERPLLCRISSVWKKIFSKKMTIQEYYTKTIGACKVLMGTKLGMSEDQITKIYDDLNP